MITPAQAMLINDAKEPAIPISLNLGKPGPSQVKVKVVASGLNPLDLKIRSASAAHARQPLPAILGLDMAGVVIEQGEGVNHLKVGDRVYGLVGGVGGLQGTLAEQLITDAGLLAKVPDNLPLRQAASIPLGFITAWEGLVDRANIQADDSLLILGGSGGVGQMAIQIARAKGARVYATGSASSLDHLNTLGATAINYHQTSESDYLSKSSDSQGFDIVFDTVGGTSINLAFKLVKAYRGRVVSALGWGTHNLAPLSFKSASYSGVFALHPLLSGIGRERFGSILEEAAKLFNAGQLTVQQDPHRFSLTQVDQAFALMTDNSNRGKVVIDIAEDAF